MNVQGRLALGVLTTIAGLAIVVIGLSRHGEDAVAAGLIGGLLCFVAAVGTIIVSRRSGHPIGWILLAIAGFATIGSATQNYAIASLVDGRSLPGAHVAAWLALWIAMPAVGLFVYLVLLFPTGKLLSPRWRPVAVATAVGTFGMIVPTALMPGPMPAIPSESNPLGIEGLGGLLTTLSNLASPIVPICAVVAVVSQVIRVRRARGDERQQIKWVAYAMVLVPILIFISQMVVPQGASNAQWLEFAMNMFAATIIPAAIGVAMLRHRLYDIDVLINRTLVYAGLTVAVAGLYLALVFVLQALLPIETDSDIAVAASTLAAAALFRPLRRRIQTFIDRRFYRRKYDASRALQELGTRLRDEVDMSALRLDIVGVVHDTVQPVHASLWLREASR